MWNSLYVDWQVTEACFGRIYIWFVNYVLVLHGFLNFVNTVFTTIFVLDAGLQKR